MKLIKRDNYLNQLIAVINTPDIKVITGVRRSGKTKLLKSFADYLEKSSKANIIEIDYNLSKFARLKDSQSLYDYVEENYQRGKQNFLLIDEIQECENFEQTINYLHAEEKFDIYLTGSNAFLLSSDLATLFTGRTFEIAVYPFSFQEYLTYFNSKSIEEAFDQYVFEGGMSGGYLYEDATLKMQYLRGVYDTLIVRDIETKYDIQNPTLLNNISDYLMDNISNLTSANNIAKTLGSGTDKTISKYLGYLCNAFAFYRFRRYDIKGKKYLSSTDKFYLSDHAFRFARLGTKSVDYGRIYENLVAIELLRRGYEVYVGMLYGKEIDFVAIRGNSKKYIQVADNIDHEETLKREIDSLLKIHDGYEKIIIARTRHPDYTIDGVAIKNIATWLATE